MDWASSVQEPPGQRSTASNEPTMSSVDYSATDQSNHLEPDQKNNRSLAPHTDDPQSREMDTGPGEEVSDQIAVSVQTSGDTTSELHNTNKVPPTDAADPPLGNVESVEDMPDDSTAPHQTEQLVTDRGSLCYTGEPQLLTSLTAPFSASNFTKGCKW